jgi:hypothetical protein
MCPDFLRGRFRLENMLKMLIAENKRFGQEINADQRHGLFSAGFRPHQSKTLVLEDIMKTTPTDCFLRKRARQRTCVKIKLNGFI